MIQIIASIIVLSFIGLVKQRMRYDRLISWLMFFAATILFMEFATNAVNLNKETFSFLWSTSKIGDITIDFSPGLGEHRLLLPLFFLSLVTILHNNIFRYEEKKSAFNAFILLNFASLSLLTCSENYVQMTTAVFVTDILGYLILKDVDSSHRYVIYNFFADTCLFMVLALVCGKLQSLSLSDLPRYEQIGRHKDFVSLMFLIAVFIKMGLFMFQSYLLDLSAARLQRMSAVNLLFAPLTGILVLLKLHSLVEVSDLALPLLKIISLLTMIFGLLNFIMIDNLKKKLVYLNMGFLGLLLLMLENHNLRWNWQYSFYYSVGYFINLLFLKMYLYQNHEAKVSEMLNGRGTNSFILRTTLVQFVLIANIFISLIYRISVKHEQYWILASGIILICAIATVLNHIYQSPYSRKLEDLTPNPLRPVSLLVMISLLIYTSVKMHAYTLYNIGFILFFLMLCWCPLLTKLRKVYEIEWLQKEDLSKSFFFYTLVTPFMYLSRTLWLMVDFVFSEKIITAGLTGLHKLGISIFFKINRKSYTACFTFIIIGIICFLLSFYRRNLP